MTNEEYIAELKVLATKAKESGYLSLSLEILDRIREFEPEKENPDADVRTTLDLPLKIVQLDILGRLKKLEEKIGK